MFSEWLNNAYIMHQVFVKMILPYPMLIALLIFAVIERRAEKVRK